MKLPKIRFKGFEGAWEEKRLKNLVDYTTSSISAKDAKIDWKYDLYDANGIIWKTDIEWIKQQYITIIKDWAGVWRIRILPEKTIFIWTMWALLPKWTFLPYIFHYLQKLIYEKNFLDLLYHTYILKIIEKNYILSPHFQNKKKSDHLFEQLDSHINKNQQKLEKTQKHEAVLPPKTLSQRMIRAPWAEI